MDPIDFIDSNLTDKTHGIVEKHIKGGEFVKSAIYGGLDGIVTTLSIALSGLGADASVAIILALGFSSLIGDGLAMAVADYLATKSDAQFMESEEAREIKEVEKDFPAEKAEMVQLYTNMGLTKQIS